MSGNLGAFVNGNMFAGLFGPTIGVKLAEAWVQKAFEHVRTLPPKAPKSPPAPKAKAAKRATG
jgi:hypothetical protein